MHRNGTLCTLAALLLAAPASGQARWPAGKVVFTPAGTIDSTDVQAAIYELDTEKLATGGTAALATALAANGANCSAGSAPRGVSETGVAEDCAVLPTTSAAGITYPTNTADAFAVGCTIDSPTTCPLHVDPLTGALRLNVVGSSITVAPAAAAAGTNVNTLDANILGAVANPTGNQVKIFTGQDGEVYKLDAGDAAPLRFATLGTRCGQVSAWKNEATQLGNAAQVASNASLATGVGVNNNTIVWAGTITAADYLEFYTQQCAAGATFPTDLRVLNATGNRLSYFTLVRLDDVGSTAFGQLSYATVPAAYNELVTQSEVTCAPAPCTSDFTVTSGTRLTVNTTGRYLLTAAVGIAFDRTQ